MNNDNNHGFPDSSRLPSTSQAQVETLTDMVSTRSMQQRQETTTQQDSAGHKRTADEAEMSPPQADYKPQQEENHSQATLSSLTDAGNDQSTGATTMGPELDYPHVVEIDRMDDDNN
jgi:hypothetical protein